jgi:BirA family biotin operon repressor/biotin-[acetyl-CoA-carboxylase] ligase
MSLDVLLSVLADGQFHSGDELGEMLGVSRTAVWKQLKKVEELNLPLVSVKGKGYYIDGGLDLLSQPAVEADLSAQAVELLAELDLRGVVDSTNAIAMQKAASGSGYVCTAEQQTAGKGRRGKAWVSPYGCNLYVSAVWEFSGGAAALEGLSLAVGIAVVEALAAAGVTGATLKWPNDVLYDGRKLAGILLEMTGDAAGPCQVVVGIGLNVSMPAGSAIDQPWIDVSTIDSQAAQRNKLLALLLNALLPLLAEFEQKGFRAYRDRWQSLDAFVGKEVVMMLGQQAVVGIASGVDEGGAMVVETASGKQVFSGGEVSLRMA